MIHKTRRSRCSEEGNDLSSESQHSVRSPRLRGGTTFSGRPGYQKRGDELLATFHAMLKGKPLVPPLTHGEEFRKQLDEVNGAITPEGWKGNAGEWSFSFHPAVYDPNRWTELAELESLVFQRSVRMRHQFPPSYKGTHAREWGIANDLYGDPWALTRAGLFVYHRPFREKHAPISKPFSGRFRQTDP